ncbi:TPA: adenosylmethionine decarboxylase [candidate division WWE3 bacterium]|uniref:S-adenosylmethionine decarboxylase proenzyme n=3 Tax=Katanobacteria TaxID=422282 RepID=A0A0G1KMD3_UNCKA|nr:MAG: S-adenosylmethionine decarboxylase proenzyme [candidate division WWE3 bacterium GW2011_GWA2_44_16]KKT84683.1 MAG: S-adenosylmethionine decarboxylase proenzyme [candidate division WWE3 bacterium GW2011_GWC2_44_9]HAZ29260.1 adenosylmethionine decarboxylase [candidate division WWE3 bacterium]
MQKTRQPKYKDTRTIKFGEHLIFDAYGCDPKKLNDLKLCTKLMLDICKMGGMKKLMDPVIIDASSNEALGGKDPGGYSGFLIIQESHISVHTFVKRGFVTVDVYSCKSFKTEGVVEYLKKAFASKDEQVIKLERGLKYPADNIY